MTATSDGETMHLLAKDASMQTRDVRSRRTTGRLQILMTRVVLDGEYLIREGR